MLLVFSRQFLVVSGGLLRLVAMSVPYNHCEGLECGAQTNVPEFSQHFQHDVKRLPLRRFSDGEQAFVPMRSG